MKLFYLATRKPGFSPDEFTRRWRMHGAVAMSTAFWRHALCYVQAEVVRPIGIEGASDAYDGVAYLVVKDDAGSAPRGPEDLAASQAMLDDEKETFAGPIPNVSLWVSEERIKPGEPGGVTAFLFFQDAAQARQAAESCRDQSSLNRVTLNTRVAAGVIPSTLPFEAVVEISAFSLAVLNEAAHGPAKAAIDAADLTVVTRECVLWDRMATVVAG
jgi:hypothetical protein